ncbi:Rho GTPase activation protein [Auricularia subglabra TFB-10046 SS5]|nr:Rho GTPase activation protein [Auricularia subglabra TFB-10046 SS5]
MSHYATASPIISQRQGRTGPDTLTKAPEGWFVAARPPAIHSVSTATASSLDNEDAYTAMFVSRPSTPKAEPPQQGRLVRRRHSFIRSSENDSADADQLIILHDTLPLSGDVETVLLPSASAPSRGRIFGVDLDAITQYGFCNSIVNGRKHPLPIAVFSAVEEIYGRGGVYDPRLFNLIPTPRLAMLIDEFDSGLYYGDGFPLYGEDLQDVCELLRVYLERLPHPVIDVSMRRAFLDICCTPALTEAAAKSQISAAQILLRLLPRAHFNLAAYLLAFFAQIARYSVALDCRAVVAIFAHSLLSSRTEFAHPGHARDSQRILDWLLRHWFVIAAGLFTRRPVPGRDAETGAALHADGHQAVMPTGGDSEETFADPRAPREIIQTVEDASPHEYHAGFTSNSCGRCDTHGATIAQLKKRVSVLEHQLDAEPVIEQQRSLSARIEALEHENHARLAREGELCRAKETSDRSLAESSEQLASAMQHLQILQVEHDAALLQLDRIRSIAVSSDKGRSVSE